MSTQKTAGLLTGAFVSHLVDADARGHDYGGSECSRRSFANGGMVGDAAIFIYVTASMPVALFPLSRILLSNYPTS